MTTKEKLTAIGKIILGKAVVVELAQMKLADGTTILEADSFEAGMEVYVVTPDGNVPVPVGEYELESGQVLVVVTEGMIEEIKDMPAEEEIPTPANPEEMPGGEPGEQQMERQPKRTIESVTKEHHFSAELEAIKAELSKLKEENERLTSDLEAKNLELSSEPAVAPISYNPENEQKAEVFKYATKRAQDSLDRVLNKMY